jgi:hypothetical protein
MEWRDSLRANLSLWPNLTVNLAALSSCSGKPWDESEFLAAIKSETDSVPKVANASVDEQAAVENDDSSSEQSTETKAASTSRSVRQTIEIMILGGLAFRDETKVFHLTDLGQSLLSFLRIRPIGTSLANSSNIHLAGRLLLPGLLAVPEYRSVLLLCAAADGWITTEEVNRAIRVMSPWSFPDSSSISALAARLKAARISGDVTEIGPRWYRDEDYATPKAGDQRKAVNPWVLLAGGGGLILMQGEQYERRVHPLLLNEIPLLSLTTSVNLYIPTRNIVENSKVFAQSFSKLCL